MGETRDHLEQHGCAGMVFCARISGYQAERCKECPDPDSVECLDWQADEPAPDEAPAKPAEQHQAPDEPILRHLNMMASALTLPDHLRKISAPVILHQIRTDATRLVESRNWLHADHQRLEAIVKGMKMLETIEQLRAEVKRLTGIADAEKGGADG